MTGVVCKYGKLPKEYQDPVWWGDLKRRLEYRGFDLSKGYRSPWYDNHRSHEFVQSVSFVVSSDCFWSAFGSLDVG